MPDTPTLIAYGSLMSGHGLASLAPLPAIDARRVRLVGCRRGFGKLSQYGDRFAMVLEPAVAGEPIFCEPIGDATPIAGGVDALAVTVRVPELARVAAREGYRADTLLALARQAEAAGETLGAHLWRLFAAADFDVASYRRALADAVDYTSPHYIPHPVATEGGEPAIVFLPPGDEGSGRADVVPVRVQSAETRLLMFRDVWRLKPNPSQLDYAAMCILGEAHNLSLADVLDGVKEYPPLARRLAARIAVDLASERASFRAALGLGADLYAARFPASPRRATFLAG